MARNWASPSQPKDWNLEAGGSSLGLELVCHGNSSVADEGFALPGIRWAPTFSLQPAVGQGVVGGAMEAVPGGKLGPQPLPQRWAMCDKTCVNDICMGRSSEIP